MNYHIKISIHSIDLFIYFFTPYSVPSTELITMGARGSSKHNTVFKLNVPGSFLSSIHAFSCCCCWFGFLILEFFVLFCFVWPCCVACGILVPWPGVEPRPSTVKAQSPNHWADREFPLYYLFNSHTNTRNLVRSRPGFMGPEAYTIWGGTLFKEENTVNHCY